MRIDRISENQIRCYLSKEEMNQRQIRLRELAYGTEKAKQLFHELMQEAYARYGFTADNMPVMIEAVPLQDNSLVLTVTKVENPEELDTRFSSFAPFVKSGSSGALPGAPSPLGQLLDAIRQDLDQEHSQPENAGPARTADDLSTVRQSRKLFTFPTLGAAADAAFMAAESFHGQSSLYRDPADSRYYLFLVHTEDSSLSEITGSLSVFSEFGSSEYITPAREQHLLEHCEVICACDAVQKLADLSAK